MASLEMSASRCISDTTGGAGEQDRQRQLDWGGVLEVRERRLGQCGDGAHRQDPAHQEHNPRQVQQHGPDGLGDHVVPVDCHGGTLAAAGPGGGRRRAPAEGSGSGAHPSPRRQAPPRGHPTP